MVWPLPFVYSVSHGQSIVVEGANEHFNLLSVHSLLFYLNDKILMSRFLYLLRNYVSFLMYGKGSFHTGLNVLNSRENKYTCPKKFPKPLPLNTMLYHHHPQMKQKLGNMCFLIFHNPFLLPIQYRLFTLFTFHDWGEKHAKF